VHIGGGVLAGDLKREAARLGLDRRIEWRGAQPQPEVLKAYREADLFVLAAKVARDGDRDGLPNVLLEAQSQELACVATALPGLAELIEDGKSGVLVPPADPAALAAALERMIRSPEIRRRLGRDGTARGAGRRAGTTHRGAANPAMAPEAGNGTRALVYLPPLLQGAGLARPRRECGARHSVCDRRGIVRGKARERSMGERPPSRRTG